MAELLVLAGADTLLGREIRDSLSEHGVEVRVRELATGETPDFSDASIIVIAGAVELPPGLGATVVDATGALPPPPGAALRAPQVEDGSRNDADWQTIAHPAAIALALFFRALSPVRHAVVTAFEPASERGKAGIEEMQQQTMSLLSFKKLPQTVFDTQAVFNLLPRYGEDARVTLDSVETRIAAHLAALSPVSPALRLVHAPVFHGHAFSVWAQFAQPVAPDELEKTLSRDLIDVRTAAVEPPTNTGVAQQAGIQVGAIQFDRHDPRAAWFWIAADNIKLSADNTALVVKELAG